MDRHGEEPKEIRKPKLLLVEGNDDRQFFTALLRRDQLDDIAVEDFGGTRRLGGMLRALRLRSGHERLQSLGIVRDADADAERAFQSVRTALTNAGLPAPTAPLEPPAGTPRVTVMILPPGRPCGMLEDVCLMSVADDPAMACVDEFFACLTRCLEKLPRETSKAMVRAFLVSHELLQDSHFEAIKQYSEQWLPEPEVPNSPSVEKLHAFLATRYKPDLDLGIAAQQTEPYWNFDHPVFKPIKGFLRNL
ncbi:MAG: hypothetical protein HY914_13635 [Desulfomonile tiedjei]|nr:hypothetical protein [Desulfomonile tiedjei]